MNNKEAILDPLEFGLQLIDTGDLDPVYIALYRNGWLRYDQLQRLCVAYWCYYHLGVAAQISESAGKGFWGAMEHGLLTCPRGTERRHFRGIKATQAVQALRDRFPQPEALVSYLAGAEDGPRCALSVRGAIEAGRLGVAATPTAPTQPRGSLASESAFPAR